MPDPRKHIDPNQLADTRLDEEINLADIHPELRLDFANKATMTRPAPGVIEIHTP